MYRLEDINKNVTNYGNHKLSLYNIIPYISIHVWAIAKYVYLFLYPNGLTDLSEIWNQD